MSVAASEELFRSTKEYLLKNNLSNFNVKDQDDMLNGLAASFMTLFQPIARETEGFTDPVRLLIIDSLSIWFLRTSQFISNGEIDTVFFKELVLRDLMPPSNSTIIFQYVINFWSDGSTASVNALRDMFMKLVQLLKLIYSPEKYKTTMSSWLKKTLEIPSTLRVQYYLINALSEELDAYSILERKPNFVESSLSLMWSDSLSTPIGKCITGLLINIYRNHFSNDLNTISTWLQLWKDPVLEYLGKPKYMKSIELYILTPLFKTMPREAFIEFSQNTVGLNDNLSLISLFRLGQELGIEEEPFHKDKLVSLKSVETFLKQDKHKLPAFELLTFSTKKSRPVHGYVFEIIKRNIEIFFVDTEIETRNYFCSSFKHFILRIRDSSYGLNRTIEKLRKANKFPVEQEEKTQEIRLNESFLNWLIQYIKTQICPGTQYQRNDTAFKLLKIIIESGVDRSISDTFLDMKNRRECPFSVSLCSDLSLVRLLLDSLLSHYDDIRQSAKYSLLAIFNSNGGQDMMAKFDWTQMSQKSVELLKNYQYSDIGAVLQDLIYCTAYDKVMCVEKILDELESKLEKNKDNYIDHLNDPISGYFTSLSLILNVNDLAVKERKIVVEKCINSIFENWESTKGILCHDTDQETLPTIYTGSTVDEQTAISLAFRTVKDSSNLLNTILIYYPLTQKQLTDVGDFLIEQLFSIYHSGAFQAVLPSFQSCCLRCRKENPSQLEKWLRNILETLEFKTQYITRRSGGIPFMVSIMLTTETGRNRPLLNFAMTKLEKIASMPIEKRHINIDIPQINAFNCIRAIFIESKLSEFCSPFISSALILSLTNFNSDLWSLRNCAIMLFNSLQNRIFGKKGKSVGANQFFTRYQGLRENLLKLFDGSVNTTSQSHEGTQKTQFLESIFLVLNILSRLKATPGYSGLEPFMNRIVICLGSKVWKIRDMAARTLVCLTDDPMKWSASILDDVSIANQNFLSGYLQVNKQIFSSMKSHDPHSLRLANRIFSRQAEFLNENPSNLTAKLYIELVGSILSQKNMLVDEKSLNRFLSNLGAFFLEKDAEFTVDGSKQLCLAMTVEILLEHAKPSASLVCELGILSQYYEVQIVSLKYAIRELDLSKPEFQDIVNAIQQVFHRADNLPTVNGFIVTALDKAKAINDADLFSFLSDPFRSEDEQMAAIRSLGHVSDSSEVELLKEAVVRYSDDSSPENFRLAALQCLQSNPKYLADVNIILRIHEMLSDDNSEVRNLAASILTHRFQTEVETFSAENFSPCVVARQIGNVLTTYFSNDAIVDAVYRHLKSFFESYVVYSLNPHTYEGLFEPERDNQYRNELEQYSQYVKLLDGRIYDEGEVLEWVNKRKGELIKFLDDQQVDDTPLGWSSNPNVFSRLCILRLLIKVTQPSQLSSFDKQLSVHNIHPMVLAYSQI